MPILEAIFRSTWFMSFRRPGVFEARVHGPGAASETLAYPMPSTIAGALASLAYEAGECTTSTPGPSPYGDTDACLEKLFGSYHLYTGLARLRDRLYVYTGRALVPLEATKKALAGAASKVDEPAGLVELLSEHLGSLGSPIHSRVLRRTGVALDRSSKTASPGMLYSIGMLDPLQGTEPVEFVALVKAGTGLLEGGQEKAFTVTLGGEQRPARLVLRTAGAEPARLLSGCSGGSTVLLMLISPALLGESPWRGDVVGLTEDSATRLAESLIEAAGLGGSLEPRKPYIVQLNREPIEAVMPGWSMALGAPRPPLLLVPAGTLVIARARGDPCRAVEEAAEKGLGAYTRLGWGTVVAVA